MKSSSFHIEHQCPQCGAPADLLETDRIFQCGYCHVKSCLFSKGVFRYLLPAAVDFTGKQLVYVPYWRVKGMLFSCLESGMSHRFLDMSFQAAGLRHFPVSVGLRSQALKLRFALPNTPGIFLKPLLSYSEAMDLFVKRISATLKGPIFQQSHIGEVFSLIYSPFGMGDKIYDAVLNRPITSGLPENFDVSSHPVDTSNRFIQFLPTLCPDCGWDLSCGRDALILLCRNCDTAWQPSENGLKKIPFACLANENGHRVFMPFWNIEADVDGIELQSYADLVRLANLPKAIRNEWHHRKLSFWIPAFKIQPQSFLRISKGMTLCQPQDAFVVRFPKCPLYSVTLPLAEAFECLKIILAGVLQPPKRFWPLLPRIRIALKKSLLVYVPFAENHHEFIQSSCRVVIIKNQLQMAGNL